MRDQPSSRPDTGAPSRKRSSRLWWSRGRLPVLAVLSLLSLVLAGNAVAVAAPAMPTPTSETASPSGPVPAVRQTADGGRSPSGATCRNFYMPVTGHPTDPATHQVWGQLCARGTLSGKTVQLLVPGGAYTHVYWDWPGQPRTYSYVDYATRHGYATLNLDKLGYGLSDHPNPVLLDFRTQAHVVHQVVQYLRNGNLGTRFDTVVTNGHSMGGLTIEYEASKYQDVDGLIVSGFGHELNVATTDNPFARNTTPASTDPAFADQPWAPGYYTTKPASRCAVFSYPGDVDPRNCTVEEQTKGTLTQGELDTIVPDSYDQVNTRQITAPALWSLGIHDILWCPETSDCTTAPAADRERGYWQPGLLTQYITPQAGHSVNVGYGAPQFYARTIEWLRQNAL